MTLSSQKRQVTVPDPVYPLEFPRYRRKQLFGGKALSSSAK